MVYVEYARADGRSLARAQAAVRAEAVALRTTFTTFSERMCLYRNWRSVVVSAQFVYHTEATLRIRRPRTRLSHRRHGTRAAWHRLPLFILKRQWGLLQRRKPRLLAEYDWQRWSTVTPACMESAIRRRYIP